MKMDATKVLRYTARMTTLLAVVMLSFSSHVSAQSFGRLIDAVDLSETPSHYDLYLRFSCSVRYLTHSPVNESANVNVQLVLGNDCGTDAHNESIESPEPAVVRSIELQSVLANQIQLSILWRGVQKFVVVPTADQRGLRIRILRPGETSEPQAKVTVAEMDQGVLTGYAINLDSSLEPFDDSAVQQAQATSGVRAYTSQITIDEQRWYRLRVGPVVSQEDAKKLLLKIKQQYPRAWLAIADESIAADTPVLEPENETAAFEEAVEDASINDPQADSLWNSARTAFQKKDYPGAIQLLTKLLQQSSHKYRAVTLELMGLTHERMGQLAHAKEEYETFLREFPKHNHASRVRRRLNALRTATLPGHSRSGYADDEASQTWRYYGGIAQYYRRDNGNASTTDNTQPANPNANSTQSFTSQNALISDVDFTTRYRGLSMDARTRFSGGYTRDFLANGFGNQFRVNNAFVEFSDRDKGWYASAGRQSRASGGLLGTFDGVLGSYRFFPHFTLDAAVGLPVDTSRSGANSKRRFEALTANFGIFANAWEPSIYAVNQTLEGRTDRQAVGAELRYFKPGRVFITFVDYDVHFKVINSAVLVATLQLPWRWTLNADIEKRKSPTISTRNALIGQPVQTLKDLEQLFAVDEIKQMALDRTPDISLYSVSLSRPLTERLQFTLNAQSFKTGATQPSGTVEGFAAVGPETILSAQLLAASIFRSGDINIIGIRSQTGGPVKTLSLGFSSRLPLWAGWRLGPQLRVDRRQLASDNSIQWLYMPGLRLTLQRQTLQVDIEAGTERQNRNTDTVTQKSTRTYFMAGYRWQF